MSSEILNDKQPIVINKNLAALIGLNESIVLQQINYWIENINKPKGQDSINYQDGHYWTFNSYNEWQENFPFWSKSTIRRIIKKLEKYKFIETGNYNKMKIDRTKWYRIKHKNLDEYCRWASVQNEQATWSKWTDHISKMNRPLPESTTESTFKDYKNNNKGSLSDEKEHSASLSFKTALERLRPNEFAAENVSYYLKKYRQFKGVEHPNLKPEQWQRVFNNIVYAYDYGVSKEAELVGDEFKRIVDHHFKTNYKNSDYNILHFISGQIMINRAYELDLAY